MESMGTHVKSMGEYPDPIEAPAEVRSLPARHPDGRGCWLRPHENCPDAYGGQGGNPAGRDTSGVSVREMAGEGLSVLPEHGKAPHARKASTMGGCGGFLAA